MKRLKLDVDELRVESFEPDQTAGARRGTVHGQAKATYGCSEGWAGCGDFSDDDTCAYTCNGGATGCGYNSQCVGWCESAHETCTCYG